MDQLPALIAAVVVVLLVLLAMRSSLVTVHDYEHGLRYSRGRFRGLRGPGTFVSFGALSEIRVLDARPAYLTVEGQEVMTAEGVAIKVSLAARYLVADPVAAITHDADFRRSLYLMLQLGLRDVLAGKTVEEALRARSEIGPAVRDAIAPALAELGLELPSVEVRDLMVPSELKRAYASVIAARKEGEAALERARGETAALRNLANAGRMVEDNPGLLQLRIVQQLGSSSGNTVMVGLPDGTAAAPGAARAPVARERPPRSASAGKVREDDA